MVKKDLQGISTAIKEDDAILKIAKDKKNVRVIHINFVDGEDIVVTGSSLKNAFRAASQALQGNRGKYKCVQGFAQNENLTDKILDDHFIILSRSNASEQCRTMCLNLFNNNKEIVYVTTASMDRNAIILFEQLEEYLQSKNIEL